MGRRHCSDTPGDLRLGLDGSRSTWKCRGCDSLRNWLACESAQRVLSGVQGVLLPVEWGNPQFVLRAEHPSLSTYSVRAKTELLDAKGSAV